VGIVLSTSAANVGKPTYAWGKDLGYGEMNRIRVTESRNRVRVRVGLGVEIGVDGERLAC
jgi:hypothetical protein